MRLQLSVPSKTFLLGEYLVTRGGPGLLMNTEPRFKLILNNCTESNHWGIDPHSPAGKYIQKNAETFNDFQIQFHDPHQERGGCGASSAQFLMLYAAAQQLQHQEILPEKLLETYWQCAYQAKGIKPSGADVISQLMGNITYFHSNKRVIETVPWPFADLDCYLFRSNYKITTYQHLCQVQDFNCGTLAAVMQTAVSAFQRQDAQAFVHCVKAYQNALAAENLSTESTRELLQKLYAEDFILAAKGCGALGADVILALIEKPNAARLTRLAESLNLPLIASSAHLSPGLQVSQGKSP